MKERKTLILDLDETLVHCNETLDVPHDHKIKILFANGDEVEVVTFDIRLVSTYGHLPFNFSRR